MDERTGRRFNYSKRPGVEHAQLLMPDGEPADRAALWSAAELAEKRKDARTGREWLVALPAELDRPARIALAVAFGEALTSRHGVAIDVAVHAPSKDGDARNFHAHLMATTRTVGRSESGLPLMGPKATIELSDTDRKKAGLPAGAEEVLAVRQLWERMTNEALAAHGSDARIDMRSYADQFLAGKLDAPKRPGIHLGPDATALERQGETTDKGEVNRLTAKANAERADRSTIKVKVAPTQTPYGPGEIWPPRPPTPFEAEQQAVANAAAKKARALVVVQVSLNAGEIVPPAGKGRLFVWRTGLQADRRWTVLAACKLAKPESTSLIREHFSALRTAVERARLEREKAIEALARKLQRRPKLLAEWRASAERAFERKFSGTLDPTFPEDEIWTDAKRGVDAAREAFDQPLAIEKERIFARADALNDEARKLAEYVLGPGALDPSAPGWNAQGPNAVVLKAAQEFAILEKDGQQQFSLRSDDGSFWQALKEAVQKAAQVIIAKVRALFGRAAVLKRLDEAEPRYKELHEERRSVWVACDQYVFDFTAVQTNNAAPRMERGVRFQVSGPIAELFGVLRAKETALGLESIRAGNRWLTAYPASDELVILLADVKAASPDDIEAARAVIGEWERLEREAAAKLAAEKLEQKRVADAPTAKRLDWSTTIEQPLAAIRERRSEAVSSQLREPVRDELKTKIENIDKELGIARVTLNGLERAHMADDADALPEATEILKKLDATQGGIDRAVTWELMIGGPLVMLNESWKTLYTDKRAAFEQMPTEKKAEIRLIQAELNSTVASLEDLKTTFLAGDKAALATATETLALAQTQQSAIENILKPPGDHIYAPTVKI